MPNLNRRGFLAGFGAALFLPPAVATAVEAQRYLFGAAPQAGTPTVAAAPGSRAREPERPDRCCPRRRPAPEIPLPGPGVLSVLPGDGDLLALTVDDGVNTDVVRLYTQFAKDTGIRLTFFVNGTYRSWTDNAALLRPLVDSGQIQLGNHTWSHPDLTTLSAARIGDEITRNHTFLKNTFGVDAATLPAGALRQTQRGGAGGRRRPRLYGHHHVVGLAGRLHRGRRGLHQ